MSHRLLLLQELTPSSEDRLFLMASSVFGKIQEMRSKWDLVFASSCVFDRGPEIPRSRNFW